MLACQAAVSRAAFLSLLIISKSTTFAQKPTKRRCSQRSSLAFIVSLPLWNSRSVMGCCQREEPMVPCVCCAAFPGLMYGVVGGVVIPVTHYFTNSREWALLPLRSAQTWRAVSSTPRALIPLASHTELAGIKGCRSLQPTLSSSSHFHHNTTSSSISFTVHRQVTSSASSTGMYLTFTHTPSLP